jgi:hypothetical protein
MLVKAITDHDRQSRKTTPAIGTSRTNHWRSALLRGYERVSSWLYVTKALEWLMYS